MSCETDDSRFIVTMMGPDDQLEPALRLLSHFLGHADADDKALKTLKQEATVTDKAFGKQKDDVLLPLIRYACLGQQSEYLQQLSLAEVKALTCDELLAQFRDVQQYDCDLIYVGRRPVLSVALLSQQHLPLAQCQKPRRDIHLMLLPPSTQHPSLSTIYFYHVPKSRQNYVCTYEQLPALTDSIERTAAELWARYMGGGMSSLLFQHIREFRSLAYSTQGAQGIIDREGRAYEDMPDVERAAAFREIAYKEMLDVNKALLDRFGTTFDCWLPHDARLCRRPQPPEGRPAATRHAGRRAALP